MMSRRVSVAGVGNPEVLEIIREEMSATSASSYDINDKRESPPNPAECPCQAMLYDEAEKRHEDEKERLLRAKEIQMEEKFKERIENETQYLKDRFGFVLQNEQVRASFMLREAHRERQEKISALQTQLECKNLAGLIYVLCAERRKSKMEILRLTEEYTNYIRALQNILEESQALILHLSRGYKTAARVDNEWRQKFKKIMEHFQSFVFDYVGGSPETNQYFFDIPALLKTKTAIKDDPDEDPCDDEEETEENMEQSKVWWETLEDEDRPFVVFGSMAEFTPPQRRAVLRTVKAAKTAPRKWKEYVFNDMYLKRSCPNDDINKNAPVIPGYYECPMNPDRQASSRCQSETQSRRVTMASMDVKANMGSILKIVSNSIGPQTPKATLLGARDSMEIASTTRLREKHRSTNEQGKVVLNIGNKIDSMFSEMEAEDESFGQEADPGPENVGPSENLQDEDADDDNDDVGKESLSNLGSIHHDSLEIIPTHHPDLDSKINYEKICPMEECQRMQVDSFLRSLPDYMRANPFTHFEQTYENYQACSPEQLEILKKRIEDKRKKEKIEFIDSDPLRSWCPSVGGVDVQTSDISLLPPCTCPAPSPTPASSSTRVYNVADLIPVKQELDRINAECFFADEIQFNRFKLLGQIESDDSMNFGREKDFGIQRLNEIKKILKQHPSLCELFQANTHC